MSQSYPFQSHKSVLRVLLSVAGFLFFSSPAAAQYLYNRTDLPTGTQPSAVIGADFNGDGALDLAVANSYGGTVSIMLAKVDGTYTAKVDYTVGPKPVALAAADFNGDGKLDLAVVNSNCGMLLFNPCTVAGASSVSILLGNGDGTFNAHVDYPVGTQARAIVAANFGNGKIDLAVANQSDSTVSVLVGNGDGSFQSQVTYTVGSMPTTLSGGDFNGDGKFDLLAVGTGFDVVTTLLGNGDGTFTRKDSADYWGGASVAVGDFNSDGILDFISCIGPGTTTYPAIMLGNGDGTFQKNKWLLNLNSGAMFVVAGDFNNDGKLDVALSGQIQPPYGAEYNAPFAAIYLGNGNGTFQPAGSSSEVGGTSSIFVGDFNGDGQLDVAGTDGVGIASILLGNGDGTLDRRSDFTLPGNFVYGPLLVADFNNDTKPDVVVAQGTSSSAEVTTMLGNGDGTLQSIPVTTVSPYVRVMVAGDFNHDGNQDIALAPSGQPLISVLPGTGDGGFLSAINTSLAATETATNMVAGDFNQDGKMDLAVSIQNSINTSIVLFSGNGDGTFTRGTTFNIFEPRESATLVSGDFNKDSKLDLAYVNSNALYVMLGNGNGTFSAPVPYAFNPGGGGPVLLGDFNGDGIVDVVALSSPGITVFLGKGDGTFQPHIDTSYFTGIQTISLAAGDFNGDGKTDVALFSNELYILVGNGDGTFQPMRGYIPLNGYYLASGDFNSDGTADLVATGSSSQLSLFLSAPLVNFFPGVLTFASQSLNQTSPEQSVTLTNIGSAPMSILGINTLGDFAKTTTCGATVAQGANCTMGVTFTPTSPGNQTGAILVADNIQTSPQHVLLKGSGLASAVGVEISPQTLSFGGQALNTASSAKTITLTSTGQSPLSISSIAASQYYAQTNTCGASVAAGASCTISVTFTPTVSGSHPGTLSITDNASGSPHTVVLSGTGGGAGAGVSATSLTFTNQTVDTSSSAQAITLTNSGGSTLTLTGIVVTGNFSQTNTCGSSLAAGANCTISVKFTPTATGIRTGTLTITDNAPNSPQTVTLSGTGVVPGASLSTTYLTFGNQNLGTSSPGQVVTFTNTGGAALNIAGVAVSGDFSMVNTCGSSLAVGANCSITVTFTPTVLGSRTGSVTIADDAPGATQNVTLGGYGVNPTAFINPSTLTFTSQAVGSSSAAQPVTFSTATTGPTSITSIAASGDFSQTNTCGSTVASGLSCTISVVFTPTAGGTRSGTLTITDNATGSPQTVALTGIGTGSVASLAPGSLTFDGQLTGTTSSAQSVTLSNTGTAPLTITNVAASAGFAETNTCTASVAAGANCTISVTFHPTAGGGTTGTLTITDSAPGSPHTVSLTGTGEDFSLAAASGSTSATVTAGQPATYTLNMGSLGGLNQTINFTCTGAPSQATCKVNPSSVTPNGASPVTLTVSVTTTAASLAAPNLRRTIPPNPDPRGWLLLSALALLALIVVSAEGGRRRDLRFTLATVALVVLVLTLAACGGGGGGGPVGPPVNTGTPTGTYILTVTGTVAGSAGLQHSTTLTLKVG